MNGSNEVYVYVFLNSLSTQKEVLGKMEKQWSSNDPTKDALIKKLFL